jgi:hypothetical protein
LTIQQSLDNNPQAPTNIKEHTGVLDALRSPRNRNAFEQIVVQPSQFAGKAIPAQGNLPKVEVVFEAPNCDTDGRVVDGCAGDPCADKPVVQDIKQYRGIDITRGKLINGQFAKEDLAQLCETPSERLATYIRRDAELLKRAINADLIDAMEPLFGNYSDGASSATTPKTLNIINPDGHVNRAVWALLMSEFRKQYWSGDVMHVGGDLLNVFMDVARKGGIGAQGIGADAVTDDMMHFDDFELDTHYGDALSHLWTWAAGQFQFLEAYKYIGYCEEFFEDFTKTTIEIDGITYDYSLYYDKCNSLWKYELSLCYDLFCIDDWYTPCYDFNRKLHWVIGCGETDCTQFFC